MSEITINVPKGTEEIYKTFLYEIVETYSPSDLKEILVSELSEKSKKRLENINNLNFVNY